HGYGVTPLGVILAGYPGVGAEYVAAACERTVCGNEGVVDDNVLAASALQPRDVPRVLDDREIRARDDGANRPVGSRRDREDVRGVVGPARKLPVPGNPKTTCNRLGA